MPVGIGLGIAGVAGAGASIIGGSEARHDQNEATNTAISMQGPYVNAGTTALGQIDDPNTLMANYRQSPGFQWGLQQGENSVLTNSAMNGLLRSGGAAKALDTYATGAADQDYNNWFGQEEGIAKMGQDAATNVSSLLVGQGKNNANADIGISNAVGNGIGSIAGVSTNPLLAQMLNNNKGGASSYGSSAGASAGASAGSMFHA